MYYCTFTCYKWIPLFDIVNGYDLVYKWFEVLRKAGHETVAYTIMPNHLHVILFFPTNKFDLNKIIANAKRFLAYGIVKRLETLGRRDLLDFLSNEVSPRERKKGQLHKVFSDSFDAKGIYTDKFFNQKLNYIHLNPVRGKWRLVDDYRDYEHSSASFYELGIVKHFRPFDFRTM